MFLFKKLLSFLFNYVYADVIVGPCDFCYIYGNCDTCHLTQPSEPVIKSNPFDNSVYIFYGVICLLIGIGIIVFAKKKFSNLEGKESDLEYSNKEE